MWRADRDEEREVGIEDVKNVESKDMVNEDEKMGDNDDMGR